jgi:hypothetical protein
VFRGTLIHPNWFDVYHAYLYEHDDAVPLLSYKRDVGFKLLKLYPQIVEMSRGTRYAYRISKAIRTGVGWRRWLVSMKK